MGRRRASCWWTSTLAALLMTLVAGRGATVTAQTLADPLLDIQTYANGFTSPSFFRFLPVADGAPLEFLVCEIGLGRVLHYRDGGFLGVALDLPVAFLFERGLFGIALHPNFTVEPYVFLYYTASNTGADTSSPSGAAGNRVVRCRWSGATLDSLVTLLELPAGPNHNGGALAFGPDGMLYGSIGEAGSTQGQLQNEPTGAPPNDTSMIFRLRPDGTVPADNPFFAAGGALQKCWAYGLRNVFGIDFDPASGALWATDNGAALYDEIVRLPAGANGGWRRISGPVARDPEGSGDLWTAPGAHYVDPAFSFFESFGITAIHFQHGGALGAHYDQDLFVAAHNSMTVYRFDVTADRLGLVLTDSAVADGVADDASERDRFEWAAGVGVVTDVETGPDGALYLLRFSSPSQLYRVTRRPTSDAGVLSPGARLRFVPNPFQSATAAILPVPHRGVFGIYTPSGRLVRRLEARSLLVWDGRDATGAELPAGVYFGGWEGAGEARAAQVKLVRLP